MKRKEKVAAGGVIYRKDEGILECLTILQTSHGGWCFPKGHTEKGEGLRETAVREVAEETGLVCDIVAKLPMTSYTFTTAKGNRVDKKVYWYLMQEVERVEASHAAEISEMRWVTPERLARLLTYESDRELLQETMKVIESRESD